MKYPDAENHVVSATEDNQQEQQQQQQSTQREGSDGFEHLPSFQQPLQRATEVQNERQEGEQQPNYIRMWKRRRRKRRKKKKNTSNDLIEEEIPKEKRRILYSSNDSTIIKAADVLCSSTPIKSNK